MPRIALLIFLFLIHIPALDAAEISRPILFRSTSKRVPLLEIYSSEGCKDCLSTEAWVSKLQSQTGLWNQFIPVLFSVTLWDRMGWQDAFGSPHADGRLHAYRQQNAAFALTLPSVWYQGQEVFELDTIFSSERPESHVGILEVKGLGAAEFLIVFKPEDPSRFDQLQFHGVRLGFRRTSKILAGENAGQTLMRDFLVVSYRIKAAKCDPWTCTTSLYLPEQTVPDQNPPLPQALAFWVSRAQSPTPIQAAGGYI